MAPEKAVGVHSAGKPAQRLFIPGPTDVLPEVMAAQTEPMIGHRSDEFEALFAKCEEQLQCLFGAKGRVFIVAASGSGMQEAAIRNAVNRRVLCFVNGAFSERWYNVAVGCDKEALRVDVAWNSAVKPEQVNVALREAMRGGPVEAVTVVHNETSTGVTSPIAEIAAAVRELNEEALVMVDAVSSFGGVAVPFDAWGLDICLTSSQKAMALPPGLCFAAVSDRTMAKAKSVKGRGWYFDFLNLEKSLLKSTTPATPAISLMRALSVQLEHIFAEGVMERFQRHANLARRTQEWARERGFELMAEEGYRSNTVTTVTNTLGVDVALMNEFLATRGMEISNGYGQYKDRAFRIAHMGEATDEDLECLLGAIDEYLGVED
jgi:predicted phosphoserine aminotransferase